MENLNQPPTENITRLRQRFSKAQGRRDGVTERLDAARQEISDLESEEELLNLVAELFRTLIDKEVTTGAQAVERLLTEGLQAVFEDMDLQVRAEINVQRGKVAVDLITLQKQADGNCTEGDSTDAYGGSVATMESILLRVIVVLRRDMRPLLLLDESLGAVADHYVPNVGRFLSLLCRRLDMDVLAVTHNPTLVEAADHAYRIHKIKGAATFKEIR